MKAILGALIALTGVTANAVYRPDMQYTTLKCIAAVARPDVTMSVEVIEGGFAGLTELRISRFFEGQGEVNSYIVEQVQQNPRVAGAPKIYINHAENVSLSVNFTSSPDQNGYNFATLIENGQPEQVKCQPLYHIM